MHGWQAPSPPVSPTPLPTSYPPYLPTFPPSYISIFLSSTRPISVSSLPSCTPSSSPSFLSSLALLTIFSPTLLCISANHPNPKARSHLVQLLYCDRLTVATIMFKIGQVFFALHATFLCTICCSQHSACITFLWSRDSEKCPAPGTIYYDIIFYYII